MSCTRTGFCLHSRVSPVLALTFGFVLYLHCFCLNSGVSPVLALTFGFVLYLQILALLDFYHRPCACILCPAVCNCRIIRRCLARFHMRHPSKCNAHVLRISFKCFHMRCTYILRLQVSSVFCLPAVHLCNRGRYVPKLSNSTSGKIKCFRYFLDEFNNQLVFYLNNIIETINADFIKQILILC